jgi:putative phage polynucleotide kinase
MPKLIITRGYPDTGISHYAQQWVEEEPDNRIEINHSQIQQSLQLSCPFQENTIDNIATLLMNDAALKEKDIIVSNLNLKERPVKQLVKWALKHNYEPIIKDFVLDKDVLLSRANDQNNMRDLVNRYPVQQWRSLEQILELLGKDKVFEPYRNDPMNPKTIIVDIDGTLAHHNEKIRSPFEFDKVGLDDVDPVIRQLVRDSYDNGYHIIILTGRSTSCEKDTVAWLEKHDVPYHHLYMRSRGDRRADWLVKDSIIREYIQDNYYVEYCLEDRDQVVQHNRSMGYKVFQVENGDF